MQREAALDVVEGHVGLEGVHALVRLVDDQHVPGEVGHLVELLVHAAELDGALEVLKAHELDEPLGTPVPQVRQVLVACEAVGLARKGTHAADEAEARAGADELHIVVVPGVRDGGAVRHDEHLRGADAAAEVVGGQRLAEARLCVPQELAALVGAGVVGRLLNGALLLGAQFILNRLGHVQHAVVLAELPEAHLGRRGLDLVPLGVGFVGHVQTLEVTVEIGVAERLARVLVGGVAVPVDDVAHVGGVRLLLDARLHVLLGVANLRPPVVPRYLGRGIGIDLGKGGARGLDLPGDVAEGHG